MRVLVTGGSGKLGRQLKKIIDCHAPTHQELDITEKTMVEEYFREI